jgi:hypothetical protein
MVELVGNRGHDEDEDEKIERIERPSHEAREDRMAVAGHAGRAISRWRCARLCGISWR